ncbi:MAG TPA: type II toxin-antitoxin system mRNA interferase toxin, RelE/StbE family [Chloroflexota bacterium]|nr:type II toxin-antitoxin system mRNA interferase toxin, RelE/StbE family [Chloroflexota bacterium]
MRLVPTSAFRRRRKKLTRLQRAALARALGRFRADPFDPLLRTHKLSGELAGKWSFSAMHDLRVVCVIEGGTAYLLAIGTHDEVY